MQQYANVSRGMRNKVLTFHIEDVHIGAGQPDRRRKVFPGVQVTRDKNGIGNDWLLATKQFVYTLYIGDERRGSAENTLFVVQIHGLECQLSE